MASKVKAQSVKDSNPKDAIGSLKAPLSTVPMGPIRELGLAMLEGSIKYGRHNYRVIGVRSSVYFDAAMRHLTNWWEGEDFDPDSGLSHIVKAIASLVVLRDAMLQDMLHDDRPPAMRDGSAFNTRLNEVSASMITSFEGEPKAPYIREDAVERS